MSVELETCPTCGALPCDQVTRPASPVGVAAAARVAKYLSERAKLRQTDPEEIHGLHVGDDREAILRASDLRAILAALSPTALEQGSGAFPAKEPIIPTEREDGAVVVLLNQIADLCTSFNDQIHDADDTLGQICQLAYRAMSEAKE